MATHDPGPNAIFFCGDPTLFHQWQAGSPIEARFLSIQECLTPSAAHPSATAANTLILTLLNESRLSLNTEPTPADALALLDQLAAVPNRPSVILLTSNGLSLDVCCAAVRRGVSHFVDVDALGWEKRLTHLLETGTLAHRRIAGEANAQELLDYVGIRAISSAMQELIMRVYRGAQVSDATVLIHGESGTGKQLLAEAIHRLDPKRAKNTFVPVNCAAITGTLAESELFGHTKGAFSGATDARQGYFRSANKGTIFLDEISELPLYLQPKLLRVLQERRVLPVGADREEPIDVRVIAATNVSLQEKVAKGEFRLDLYQRLNVIHLAVPPLRRRTEDIPLLVQHFLKKYQHYCPTPVLEVDPRVTEFLKRKAGNGNVRELENLVRQSLVFKASGDRLELQDLPAYLFDEPDQAPPSELISSEVVENLLGLIRSKRLTLKQAVEQFERTIIQKAAKTSPGLSKIELAKALGIPRRTLYYKLDAE